MTLEEAKEKYKSQWILARVLHEDDETKEIVELEVIAHSRSREKINSAMKVSEEKRIAVFYTGRIPKRGYVFAL